MGTYEFLPHTADEKFLVKASSLSDAFSTSVSAFYEILLGKNYEIKSSARKEIVLKAKKIESLLYDFLNELVFFFDDADLLLPNVEKLEIIQCEDESFSLEAILSGDKKYDYDLVTEIKNMTYNEMDIKQELDGSVKMTVVVDI
ncbi:MAG: archease [Patescibacteria group bacterium]|nr:archease [Patescibacteria group bacterium]